MSGDLENYFLVASCWFVDNVIGQSDGEERLQLDTKERQCLEEAAGEH